MRHFCFIAALFANNTVCAECYVIENMAGYIAANREDYKIVDDGMKERKFFVQINGQGSSVSPSDLSCIETSSTSLLCSYNKDGQSTVETWAVDPTKKKAYYTQTRSGFGPTMNNAKLLVGDIVGRCP